MTLRVPLPEGDSRQEVVVCGHQLVVRRSRDGDVRLGAGLVLVSGGFPSRGGSVANPRLETWEGTVLEVRDLPAGTAARIVQEVPGSVVVDQHAPADALERAGQDSPEQLRAERALLLARLAQIDAALAGAR